MPKGETLLRGQNESHSRLVNILTNFNKGFYPLNLPRDILKTRFVLLLQLYLMYDNGGYLTHIYNFGFGIIKF